MTLAELNRVDRAGFVAALGAIFEHSPWVAEAVVGRRPFASIDALHAAMADAVAGAPAERQLALIRAHPELAGSAAIRGELTAESTSEQAGAGLAACSPAEYARIASLNARYSARFGFPFILAVKGRDRADVIAALERRVDRTADEEREENLRQIARIARFRLGDLLGR